MLFNIVLKIFSVYIDSVLSENMYRSGNVQYIGEIPRVHRGNIMSTLSDVQYIRGNHDACGGAT